MSKGRKVEVRYDIESDHFHFLVDGRFVTKIPTNLPNAAFTGEELECHINRLLDYLDGDQPSAKEEKLLRDFSVPLEIPYPGKREKSQVKLLRITAPHQDYEIASEAARQIDSRNREEAQRAQEANYRASIKQQQEMFSTSDHFVPCEVKFVQSPAEKVISEAEKPRGLYFVDDDGRKVNLSRAVEEHADLFSGEYIPSVTWSSFRKADGREGYHCALELWRTAENSQPGEQKAEPVEELTSVLVELKLKHLAGLIVELYDRVQKLELKETK